MHVYKKKLKFKLWHSSNASVAQIYSAYKASIEREVTDFSSWFENNKEKKNKKREW